MPTNSKDTLVELAHLVAVLGLVILSPREHYRSVSPSTSLVVYLSIRTFLNVSSLLLAHDRGPMTIQALRTIIEVGNLIIESQNKTYSLLNPFLGLAPEETAGPWSKASFAWVASILFTGKDNTFSLESLPQNPHRFDPSNLRRKILLTWDQRGKLFSCIECMKLTEFCSEAREPLYITVDLGTLSYARLCYHCNHQVYAHRVPLRSTTSHK